MSGEDIAEKALVFAKVNAAKIINDLAGDKYEPESMTPISMFMAGHPGAGKTELARAFNLAVEDAGRHRAVHIDPDEIRKLMPGYTGENAYLFQRPVSLIVDKIHDHVLLKKKNFILDGTFSNINNCQNNIKRSIDKGRTVFIYYVFQDPTISWRVTKARQISTGRTIPKEAFIEQVYESIKCVDTVKKQWPQIYVGLIIKDAVEKKTNLISNVSDIESMINVGYTKQELEGMLDT